jgi:hypothetical protein
VFLMIVTGNSSKSRFRSKVDVLSSGGMARKNNMLSQAAKIYRRWTRNSEQIILPTSACP